MDLLLYFSNPCRARDPASDNIFLGVKKVGCENRRGAILWFVHIECLC